MPFSKVKSHELASCFNGEADLAGKPVVREQLPDRAAPQASRAVPRLAYAAR
jgi:hypothetical protein